MKDLMGLFAVRKGDREIMLNKRDSRPAMQMIQLVDSEEEEESVKLSKKRLVRRNFFKKRSKPVFSKFDDEMGGSPSNAYQPPPAHLFLGVAPNDEKEKTITIAGTHSTDSSSTTHEYQPPTFRIAAIEPSLSVVEVQRACSPSVDSDRRSSSSFVQFAFDADFQRIEELAMFGEEPTKETAAKDVSKKAFSKKANTSLDFPTLSFENMAMQNADAPKNVSPSQSVVSVTNATITGFDDGVPMTYTEETTTNTDPFVVARSNEMDAFGHPFKIDAIASHGSGELLGTQWIEANVSFPEPKATSSHDSSSLIESIIRPKKSSSWDLECRKPKKVGIRDPSPRSNNFHRSDDHQQWGEEFGVSEFPEGGGEAKNTPVFSQGRTEFPEVVHHPVLDKSDFLFDKEDRFSEIGFPSFNNVQPVNEIVINEQTNCIKGLPASAIAASMIFRQTIAVNKEEEEEEEERPCHENDNDDDFDSFHSNAGYFPDGTPMEVLADRPDDSLSSISSLTGSAFPHHKRMDVWGRQAQNVINHWNFAAKKVREEMTSPSPSKKSHGYEGSSAKKSVSDELMNMFSP